MRGISIIGAAFTLLVLAIFGAAIVSLVATGQESRRIQIEKEQAFYEAQAGLEYAIREFDQGGFPVTTNKTLGRGLFRTSIDFPQRLLYATGVSGDVTTVRQITYNPMGGDCVAIDGSHNSLSGPNKTDLNGLTISKTCHAAVQIDKVKFVWQQNRGEKVKKIVIDGVTLYDSGSGATSGTLIDIPNVLINNAAAHPVDLVRFSGNMNNKQMYMVVYLTDTTYKSQVFVIGHYP